MHLDSNQPTSAARIQRPEARRCQVFVEFLLVFIVFALHGAWPVPDVNEAYYVGKAIHFWNPDWIACDSFLDSADSHWFFCLTFGWVSLLAGPAAIAWTGRILTWLLLALAWRRLSYAVVPRRWFAVLTAAAFATLIENFHLAGEWVIGGVESKGFAYFFVFLGLEAIARARWNRAWVLFGAASAFHVLVGGWSVVAAGLAWLWIGKNRPSLGGMLPALLLGGAVSLLGLVPALLLTRQVSPEAAQMSWVQLAAAIVRGGVFEQVQPEIVDQAHRIYVFRRLPHHLAPNLLPPAYLFRFGLLTLVWVLAFLPRGRFRPAFAVQSFVGGTLLIAGVGMAIAFGIPAVAARYPQWQINAESVAAPLLRFYWFRLSDFAVPMGVALGLPRLLLDSRRMLRRHDRRPSRRPIAVASLLAAGLIALAGWGVWQLLINLSSRFSEAKAFDQVLNPAVAVVLLLLPMFTVVSIARPLLLKALPIEVAASRGRIVGFMGAVAVWTLLGVVPGVDLIRYAALRTRPMVPRGDVQGAAYVPWRLTCGWIADSGRIPRDAKFLIPRTAATFKWHARRADVGNWKEIPQDAQSIYDWYWRILRLHAYRHGNRARWNKSLAWRLKWTPPDKIRALGQEYDFQYIVAESHPPVPHLRCLYRNEYFAVYALADHDRTPDDEPETRAGANR